MVSQLELVRNVAGNPQPGLHLVTSHVSRPACREVLGLGGRKAPSQCPSASLKHHAGSRHVYIS